MSDMTISLSDLLGRRVRDVNGESLGRIEELNADVDPESGGAEYVVTSVEVGRYGPLDMVASGAFVQQLVKRLIRASGYVRYDIPWDWIDLSDPRHPRVLRPASELPTTGIEGE
jgi:sporulation protein YlmC with PRC-barrel domain